MNSRIWTLAVLIVAISCVLAGAAQAVPVKVNVRIEGNTKTIFEGPVTTDVHAVTGDSTGAHPCDGTNGGAHITPGPTATGALDDAAKLAGFTWAGKWSNSFSDFEIDRVGPDSATSSLFWGLAVNGQQPSVGGCQFEVAPGQEVLWAFDLFDKKHLLHLTGPRTVRAGKAFKLNVTDEQNNSSISGATVAGKKSNAAGVVTLRFRTPGTKRLKARRSDSVRSNQLLVKVLPAKAKHGG